LRVLEYYPGILFLTTNRVGIIDDAFRSRLHLTLYYPDLSSRKALKIWEKNITRFEMTNQQRKANGRPSIEIDNKKILKWAKLNWEALQWNGRQIRNAFQTAIALADFEARQETVKGKTSDASPKVKVSHFNTIALASEQFNQYLLDTHGKNENELADREKLRAQPSKIKRLSKVKEDEESEESGMEVNDSDDSGSGSEESDAPRKKKSSSQKRGKKDKKTKSESS